VNLRWVVFDYLDPEVPVRQDVRSAIRRALLRPSGESDATRKLRDGVLVVIACLSVVGIGIYGGYVAFQDATAVVIALGLSVLLFAVVWVGAAFQFRRKGFAIAREQVKPLGYEICPDCGIWIRDVPEDLPRCPECGAEREPMPEDDA
jgi:hypothetical protein